jgi:hypothetical protein
VSVDEAKDYVASKLIFPDYDLLPMIEKANSGYVIWCSAPPSGVNYQTHKFSFIDAVMTGLKLCGTNCVGDWVVLGGSSLAVVRTLPPFVLEAEPSSGKINRVGKLLNVQVYAYPTAAHDSFWVGHGTKCSVGTIRNE